MRGLRRDGGPGLWIVGIIGVLLTALYIFRVIFMVFFGTRNTPVTHRPRYRIIVPVIVLAALSLVGGLVKTPLLAFLHNALPALVDARTGSMTELSSAIVSGLAFLVGLGFAYLFFIRNRQYADSLMASPTARLLHAFWLSDWGLDWLYDRAFVRPVVWMAAINRRDAVDSVFSAIAWINRSAHYALSRTQTGSLRWYAAVVGAGAVIFAGVILLT